MSDLDSLTAIVNKLPEIYLRTVKGKIDESVF